MKMKKTRKRSLARFAAVLLAAAGTGAQAAGLEFEVTPYLWTVSTDADVTVGNETVRVKRDIDDVDMTGGVLGVGRIDRWVLWTQLDFMSLDTNELHPRATAGRLQTDALLATAGFGYQFGRRGGRTYDVLVGARHLSLKNTLALEGNARLRDDADFSDPVIIVRPSVPLADRWRLNPTLSLGGGGKSELTWEMQPQIQYQLGDGIALRFGYRRVYYDIDRKNAAGRWDGTLQGAFFGIGGTFGGSDRRF